MQLARGAEVEVDGDDAGEAPARGPLDGREVAEMVGEGPVLRRVDELVDVEVGHPLGRAPVQVQAHLQVHLLQVPIELRTVSDEGLVDVDGKVGGVLCVEVLHKRDVVHRIMVEDDDAVHAHDAVVLDPLNNVAGFVLDHGAHSQEKPLVRLIFQVFWLLSGVWLLLAIALNLI